jgi:DNA topoisomerase VI subunit B
MAGGVRQTSTKVCEPFHTPFQQEEAWKDVDAPGVLAVTAAASDKKAKTAKPIAEALAATQKEISVAEFFERNRQILGFDSPLKALITAIKEATDNALDACEEAGILPDVAVTVEKTSNADELKVTVSDNGPGIVKRQLGNIFGRLLYGSRFHAIRQ